MSACPLSSDAEGHWRVRLREALGPDVAVTFETNAALIGGAELHFPHAALSFSVGGAIRALQEEAAQHDEPH